MSIQHALPTIDMRPLCPACGQPSDVLAQWSPFKAKPCVCRACSTRYPFPMHIVTIGANGQPTYTEDATYDDKNAMVTHESALREHISTRRKPKPPRIHLAKDFSIRQTSIPLCLRCGGLHAVRSLVDYATYCPRCDGEMSVESLAGLMRSRFGDDDEAILDHLYQYSRDLFDAGVLPDYWFALKGKIWQPAS